MTLQKHVIYVHQSKSRPYSEFESRKTSDEAGGSCWRAWRQLPVPLAGAASLLAAPAAFQLFCARFFERIFGGKCLFLVPIWSFLGDLITIWSISFHISHRVWVKHFHFEENIIYQLKFGLKLAQKVDETSRDHNLFVLNRNWVRDQPLKILWNSLHFWKVLGTKLNTFQVLTFKTIQVRAQKTTRDSFLNGLWTDGRWHCSELHWEFWKHFERGLKGLKEFWKSSREPDARAFW